MKASYLLQFNTFATERLELLPILQTADEMTTLHIDSRLYNTFITAAGNVMKTVLNYFVVLNRLMERLADGLKVEAWLGSSDIRQVGCYKTMRLS